MVHRCPPWLCFTFDNRFRRRAHDPVEMLGPFVREGMTALDIGPGKGYFTIPLARMVGEGGRVVAADIEPEMLQAIEARAAKAGVAGRVTTLLVRPDALEYPAADFVLLFWMLHEIADTEPVLREIRRRLKPGGRVFIAEPKLHVGGAAFEASVKRCEAAGFAVESRPRVSLSRAVVLR
jgi:ubiquinone/menaquinone biosynthesis C-methylase UbiE